MRKRIALAPAIVASFVAFGSLDARAQSLSPAQAYGEALKVMAALPQPAGFKFDATIAIKGAGVKLNHEKDVAALQIGIGRGFDAAMTWPPEFRTAGGGTATLVSDGATYKVRSPLFKPTWRTASVWSRYGFRGQVDATPAPAAPEPVAVAPAGGSEGGPVIGRIQSLNPGGYKIEDGAPETCASAKTTRHLHFIPIGDSKTHPLTDVIVDDGTKRVCSMRFRVAAQRSAITLTGYVLRFFGVGFKTAAVSFDYRNFVMEAA